MTRYLDTDFSTAADYDGDTSVDLTERNDEATLTILEHGERRATKVYRMIILLLVTSMAAAMGVVVYFVTEKQQTELYRQEVRVLCFSREASFVTA